ncbi:hypothetical protein VNO77_19604 [Canavalia gladiata]|uniref:Uncharacterized protein n=1 Tax=Canavalia gladiata TaxID=3824 RepID=A0AAN9LN07_CANGL
MKHRHSKMHKLYVFWLQFCNAYIASVLDTGYTCPVSWIDALLASIHSWPALTFLVDDQLTAHSNSWSSLLSKTVNYVDEAGHTQGFEIWRQTSIVFSLPSANFLILQVFASISARTGEWCCCGMQTINRANMIRMIYLTSVVSWEFQSWVLLRLQIAMKLDFINVGINEATWKAITAVLNQALLFRLGKRMIVTVIRLYNIKKTKWDRNMTGGGRVEALQLLLHIGLPERGGLVILERIGDLWAVGGADPRSSAVFYLCNWGLPLFLLNKIPGLGIDLASGSNY